MIGELSRDGYLMLGAFGILGQALRSVIYGVSPGDPGLLALVFGVLLAADGLAFSRPAKDEPWPLIR
jgi:hypothetical protein